MHKLAQSTAGKLLIFTVCFFLLAGVFYWIVAEDWAKTAVETDAVTPSAQIGAPLGVVEQTLTSPAETLQEFSLMPGWRADAGMDGTENHTVMISLLRDGELLFRTEQSISPDSFGKMKAVTVSPALHGLKGARLTLRLELPEGGLIFWSGNTISAGKAEASVTTEEKLALNGESAPGQLVLSLRGESPLNGKRFFWPVAGILYLVTGAVLLWSLRKGESGLLCRTAGLLQRYRYLIKQLVLRDFKVKYKASVFGMLWSFLNPLLMMAVYYFVFSTVFRSNIEAFPVYLLSGIVLFNYFSDATNLGLLSIIGNAALITKVYIPKFIFPVSKALSSAINLMISFVPLLLVMLLTGVRFTKSLLLLPLVILFLLMLCTGISLILSAMTVFFRDMQFLWRIVVTIMNFLTPIFYPESIIPEAYRTLYHLNPLYQIVYFMRCIVMGGVSPTPITYFYCLMASVIPLLLGLWIFRRKQDQFVLYL